MGSVKGETKSANFWQRKVPNSSPSANLATESENPLRISAQTMVTQVESVHSSPILARQWWPPIRVHDVTTIRSATRDGDDPVGKLAIRACFELYQGLNLEKSFKSSFKMIFVLFSMIVCSTMFRGEAWVKLSFGVKLVWNAVCLLDRLLLLLLLYKFTFSRDCKVLMVS